MADTDIDIDDEVLAYAMALGGLFRLFDPLPGKSKKTRYRETSLEARSNVNGEYIDRTNSVAHFIARLMSDRSVKVPKGADSSHRGWVIVDGRTGLKLEFRAPSEEQVRARMAEASMVEVDGDIEPVEAARRRLRAVIDSRDQSIVASRVAAWRWPPAEGSTEARVFALAQGGEEFQSCRRIKGSNEWTYFKDSTESAFLAKLKDRSLRIEDVVEHAHDSFRGKGMDLRPDQAFIDVSFSKLGDARGTPISSYIWVAKVVAPQAKLSTPRAKSKQVN
jgi:hypothetical protein